MRQTTTTEIEKMDPLARIQEEIKEVVRREQEYHRQLTATASPTLLVEGDNFNLSDKQNNNDPLDDQHNDHSVTTVLTSLSLNDDNPSNTPSLTSSVHSKESYDGHHSDDSGISASSSPVNGLPIPQTRSKINIDNNNNNDDDSNDGKDKNDNFLKVPKATEARYIGPNCYTLTPEPPQQKLAPAVSKANLTGVTKPRQFALTSAHKGVMERFINSRGKLQLNTNGGNTSPNTLMLSGKNAAAFLGLQSPVTPNSPIPELNMRNTSVLLMPTDTTLTPPVIERDADGKPIRPGYIPVEVKIQRELKDLKSRESELKKLRKIRLSTSNLLDAVDNADIDSDDEDSEEEEHCYGPAQMRSAKSINELSDLSPRATPSPSFDKVPFGRSTGGLRPAVSLAQLCDLDPEEAPSSHRLIEQWESIIQKNA